MPRSDLPFDTYSSWDRITPGSILSIHQKFYFKLNEKIFPQFIVCFCDWNLDLITSCWTWVWLASCLFPMMLFFHVPCRTCVKGCSRSPSSSGSPWARSRFRPSLRRAPSPPWRRTHRARTAKWGASSLGRVSLPGAQWVFYRPEQALRRTQARSTVSVLQTRTSFTPYTGPEHSECSTDQNKLYAVHRPGAQWVFYRPEQALRRTQARSTVSVLQTRTSFTPYTGPEHSECSTDQNKLYAVHRPGAQWVFYRPEQALRRTQARSTVSVLQTRTSFTPYTGPEHSECSTDQNKLYAVHRPGAQWVFYRPEQALRRTQARSTVSVLQTRTSFTPYTGPEHSECSTDQNKLYAVHRPGAQWVFYRPEQALRRTQARSTVSVLQTRTSFTPYTGPEHSEISTCNQQFHIFLRK